MGTGPPDPSTAGRSLGDAGSHAEARGANAATAVSHSAAGAGSQLTLAFLLGAPRVRVGVRRASEASSPDKADTRIRGLAPGARNQQQAGVRHLGWGTRQPAGVAHACFLRERSSVSRYRLDPGGSRLRPERAAVSTLAAAAPSARQPRPVKLPAAGRCFRTNPATPGLSRRLAGSAQLADSSPEFCLLSGG